MSHSGPLRWAGFWIKVQGFKSQELASVVNIGNQSVYTFLSPTNPKNQQNTSPDDFVQFYYAIFSNAVKQTTHVSTHDAKSKQTSFKDLKETRK